MLNAKQKIVRSFVSSIESQRKTMQQPSYRVDLSQHWVAKKVADSLRENRFVIVKNHEVDTNLLNEFYKNWGKFFQDNKKFEMLRTDEADEGYVPTNTETAVGNKTADLKEYYQTHIRGLYPHSINNELSKKIVGQIVRLGEKVIEYIDQIMPSSYRDDMKTSLTEMINGSDRHGFRVIHYPPMEKRVEPPRAAAHTDICMLTIIPAATAEGLELQDASGKWHRPEIAKDEILIFNADMLEMATNEYIKSTMHRVVPGSMQGREQSRYSFPIFIHPRREVELQPGVTAMAALQKRITEIGFNGELLKQ